MRIDRTLREPGPPTDKPWDNEGLRQRLQGQSVADRAIQELHAVARERVEELESRAFKRRFRRR
jgi:hypothetical protein